MVIGWQTDSMRCWPVLPFLMSVSEASKIVLPLRYALYILHVRAWAQVLPMAHLYYPYMTGGRLFTRATCRLFSSVAFWSLETEVKGLFSFVAFGALDATALLFSFGNKSKSRGSIEGRKWRYKPHIIKMNKISPVTLRRQINQSPIKRITKQWQDSSYLPSCSH